MYIHEHEHMLKMIKITHFQFDGDIDLVWRDHYSPSASAMTPD